MEKVTSALRGFMDGLRFRQAITKSLVAKCEEEEPPEIVDPLTTLREECQQAHCDKYKIKLDTCNDRVNSRKKTAETCYEELLDLFHCVDHCASHSLFSKLK